MFGFGKKKEVPLELFGTNKYELYMAEIAAHLGHDLLHAASDAKAIVNKTTIEEYLRHFAFHCYMEGVEAEDCAKRIKDKFSTIFKL